MSDRLDDAFRALREAHDGDGDEAARTRARVLLGARGARRRRISRLVVVPLAAALAIGTAWAAGSGRLAAWLEMRAPAPVPAPSRAVDLSPVPAPVSAPAPAPTPASASAPELVPVPASALPAAPVRSARDAESALYQQAHEAHFVGREPARAIDAWDAYLAKHPQGRFAPEARYNRALMLIRAGRRDEARAALRPFAEGAPGSYRQSEAAALLDALAD